MWIRLKAWLWPLVIGLAGWFAVVLTRTGPGVTSDEPFSVFYGKAFVQEFTEQGRRFFTQESINPTFASRHEHPPLGRWLIGWVHWLQDERRHDSGSVDVYAARVAPATAFALVLALLTRVVAARHGTVAGVAAGVSLALMPRVFGHAHFAALDTLVSLTYVAAILSAAWMMERPRPWLHASLAGVLFGAALLTKMHGVFLMPVVGLWALVYFRMRALLPLFLWWLSGVEVFFIGWPWLWQDVSRLCQTIWQRSFSFEQLPNLMERLTSFLSSSVDRQHIYVTYFNRDWADFALPWHYPWLMFAVTVPVGLHVLGLVGLGKQWWGIRTDPRGGLYVVALVLPLVVFSVPGVPVYDGVRMFLMVFPFWAIFVGQGAGIVFKLLAAWWRPRGAAVALAAFFACQAWGVVHYYPFHLSYYNLLIGGLRGADRRGLEVTYWGDAVTPELVNRWSDAAPPGSCAVLVPTLYNAQQTLYETELTKKRKQELSGSIESSCPYVIVYNRKAYLKDVEQVLDSPYFTPIAENAIDGVWLSRVYVRLRPDEQGVAHEQVDRSQKSHD